MLRYQLMVLSIFIFALWGVYFPLSLIAYLLYLPIKLFKKITGQEAKPTKPELEVKITESDLSPPKDELFFIHGYPDTGALWDQQVQFLKSEYRCIVVTLPNFGNKENAASWGLDFHELIPMLAKAVEQHSSKKQVTLVIHDWGSLIGFMLQTKRPDLVSRIATFDIGGQMAHGLLQTIYYWNYQLFFIYLFLIGAPIGDYVIKKVLGTIKHRSIEELKVQMNYPYYYYYFGKNKVKEYKLDAARCPVYFGYGTAKVKALFKFHSDWWLHQIKANEVHGCRQVAFKTDHFIPVEDPDGVNKSLKQWLEDTAAAVNRKPHMPTGIGATAK